jgi:DNA-binding transcriptional LysR family regulator
MAPPSDPPPLGASSAALDLRRLRHFAVLAETLNFRRAAERLHMAQPPLSVSIRKLESELGAPLFIREPAGVSLTAAGKAALGPARALLHQHEQTSGQLRNAALGAAQGTGGMLRIGFVGSASHGLLQRVLPRFRAGHPGVTLQLREATSVQIAQLLEDRVLDVGIVRVPLLRSTAARLTPLVEEHFVAALPREHPLARRKRLALHHLAQEPFVMYNAAEAGGLQAAAMLACQRAGFVPQVAQQATQVQTVLALVESGLGVALVPAVMKRHRSEAIVYRQLADAPDTSRIGLSLAHMDGLDSEAVRRFRDVAMKLRA